MKNFTNEQLRTMVSEMSGWDGSFEELHAWDMGVFNEMMEGQEPEWIAHRIYFGDFNPMHEFFRFNGYGNLESFNTFEYSEELEDRHDEIVERFTEMVEDGEIQDWENLLD